MPHIQYVLRLASREAWQDVAADGHVAHLHEAGVLAGVVAGDAPEGTMPELLPGYHVIVVMAGALPASWAFVALADVPDGVPLFAGVPFSMPVPASVTRFQARAALSEAGLLPAIEEAIAASPDPLAPIAWADASVFERGSPMLTGIAAQIGVTEAQMDALFRRASEIGA